MKLKHVTAITVKTITCVSQAVTQKVQPPLSQFGPQV